MRSLEEYIARHEWSKARTKLFLRLQTGYLDVKDYDAWGKYAGEIEKGMRTRRKTREEFWRGLGKVVAAVEARAGVRTHKAQEYA